MNLQGNKDDKANIDENNEIQDGSDNDVEVVDEENINATQNEDDDGNSDSPQDGEAGDEGSEKFKVFVGGLVNDITTDEIRTYFSKFGEVVDVMLVYDKNTHKFRGFAFVRFSTLETVNDVLNTSDHSINGRAVDVKHATAKGGPKSLPTEDVEPNKIFVGGFSPEITKDQLIEIFSQFGKIDDVNIITETHTNKSRGFCYITFESDESRKSAVEMHKVVVGDANAEIKNAIPKELQNRYAPSRRGDRYFRARPRRGGSRGGRNSDREYGRRYPYRDNYPHFDPREYDRYYPRYDGDYPYYRFYDRDRGRDFPPYDRQPARNGPGRKDPYRGANNSQLPYGGGYSKPHNKGQDDYYSYYQKQANNSNKPGVPFNKRNSPQ